MQTPLWVPLVVAGVGVLSTLVGSLGGVLITQRKSDRRDDKIWQRERDRERERWARENRARTFEHRRDAYIEFYDFLTAVRPIAATRQRGTSHTDPAAVDFQRSALEKLHKVELFGTRDASNAALIAMGAAVRWGWAHNKDDDEQFEAERANYFAQEEAYRTIVRDELAMSDSAEPTLRVAPQL